MEFVIQTKKSDIPCVVIVDEDNGQYLIRNSDATGEIFQSKQELLQWVETKWSSELFAYIDTYTELLRMLKNFDDIFD